MMFADLRALYRPLRAHRPLPGGIDRQGPYSASARSSPSTEETSSLDDPRVVARDESGPVSVVATTARIAANEAPFGPTCAAVRAHLHRPGTREALRKPRLGEVIAVPPRSHLLECSSTHIHRGHPPSNRAASSDPPVAFPAAVGMRAGPLEVATVDDQVFLADRTSPEPALEDLPGPGRVPRLGREGRAGHVRGHPVVRHRPPRAARGAGWGNQTSPA